jgi:cytochrome c-type biogenesis protein CcmH/NrfG
MMPRPAQPEFLPQQRLPSSPPHSFTPKSQASNNPVVVSLLSSASQFEAQGNLGRAVASIERGLRIAPKDAHLWKHLARIRLQQNRTHQAILLSKKSIRFAGGNTNLLADNWLVIAEALKRQGDLNGAVDAKEKAARYR